MTVTWPADFTPAVREVIIARDTPPGMGRPRCMVCGEPVTAMVVHVHHLLFKSRGGDGRPSNGIVVHGEGQGPGCHKTRIHDDSKTAAAQGWARSRHAPVPRVYRAPVLCGWRGWIVLLDRPGRAGYWRKADGRDMAGDYGHDGDGEAGE
jgi:hypothetical protein